MSWCKYCGARIDWLRTPKGKNMPVEYMPVMVMPGRGTEAFVTDEGGAFAGSGRCPARPAAAISRPMSRTGPAAQRERKEPDENDADRDGRVQ